MRKLAILTITACSLLAIAGCQQQDEDVAVTAVAPDRYRTRNGYRTCTGPDHTT